VLGGHQKSFGKTQMSKLEKTRRDSAELHADSAVFHTECKCVPGKRSWPLTLRDLRKPKLMRRSDSGHRITNTEYPMSVRLESIQEERAEEETRP
jgi:hypothetical protein